MNRTHRLLACIIAAVLPAPTFALPTAPTVAAGSATFNTLGKTLTVTNSNGAIINWNSFSIGAGETTKFLQTSAASQVLNRVTGGNPSQILGSLRSEIGTTGIIGGKVFLINPNGIAFGPGAQVNVGGLVASTLNLSDTDFLANRLNFTATPGAGTISNAGHIETVAGGQILLVAPRIENSGILKAPNGDVVLAAGKRVSIVDINQPEIEFELTPTDNQLINSGKLQASSGRIGMLGGMVMHTGEADASSVVAEGGRIRLKADRIDNSGVLKATGQTAGGEVEVIAATRLIQTQQGSIDVSGTTAGGRITLAAGQDETSGAFLSGTLKADATQGTGGDITVTGRDLYLAATQISAEGAMAGGQVRIGGDYQGNNPAVANATTTYINTSTQISAKSSQGQGGRVIVWSDEQTTFGGTIDALGATHDQGGFVEVSGKNNLHFAGEAKAKTLLLDPKNIVIDTAGMLTSFQLVDPNPGNSNFFGGAVVEVGSGNIAVTSQGDSFNGSGAGAVYLFNGSTGALIGTLRGGGTGHGVGSGGITPLPNGNYVLGNYQWDNGATANVGAVTLVNGATGLAYVNGSGVVSAANSLIGSKAADAVGSQVVVLASGNYVVASENWDNGAVTDVGAVTLVDGATGFAKANGSGVVSTANSLVGSTIFDRIGKAGSLSGIYALANGNYVVRSELWSNGGTSSVGAVTLVDGTTGFAKANGSGVVSTANSLIGSTAYDSVGDGGIYKLSNGDYVVSSVYWANVGATQAGAATLVDGTTGFAKANGSGVISSANSLVGSTSNRIGSGGITILSSGDYVVSSPRWNNGAATSAGAVTLVNGATGFAKVNGSSAVSTANSLVGSKSNDGVGGVVALANGNYVVISSNWDNGATVDVGAVTLVDGLTGFAKVNGSGVVSAANSLIGSSANNAIGGRVTVLANGNYVVTSGTYDSGGSTDIGAVTLVDGSTGLAKVNGSGVVSNANSLIGGSFNDQIGRDGIVLLANGDYVVVSSLWDSGAVIDVGAVTLVDGVTGLAKANGTGIVSTANSLVGSVASDKVGNNGVIALSNGNYVVSTQTWDNSGLTDVGAVTLVSGMTGFARANGSGVVSAANSLVGNSANDRVGISGAKALANDNYVAGTLTWKNGAFSNSGKAYVMSNGGANIPQSFALDPSTSASMDPWVLTSTLNAGTAVTLQANNDITINSAITVNNPSGNGGSLTMQAGRSILINANITTDNGDLTLSANDPGALGAYRDAGTANITMAAGTTINTGTGAFNANLNASGGTITLRDITAGAVSAIGATQNLGTTTLTTFNMSGGNLTLGAGGSFITSGLATIAAGNTLNLSGGSFNAGSLSLSGSLLMTSGSLTTGATTVASGGTLSLTGGTASFTGPITLQSGGTVTYGLAGTTSVSGASSSAGTLNFNAGTMNFTGGMTQTAGTTTFNGGAVSGAYTMSGGSMMIAGGSSATFNNGLTQTGGTTQMGTSTTSTGNITVGGTGYQLNGGTLGGSGTLTGSLTVGAATLAPGFSPGSLTITGNLNLGSTSTTTIEIGGLTAGTQFDVINVGGTANLGGTLNVTSWGGFTPAAGDSFNFLTFGSSTGSFATTNLPAGWNSTLSPFATYMQLAIPAAALPPAMVVPPSGSLIAIAPDALPSNDTQLAFDQLMTLADASSVSMLALPQMSDQEEPRQCR